MSSCAHLSHYCDVSDWLRHLSVSEETDACGNLLENCPLCPTDYFKPARPSKLKRHLQLTHDRLAVTFKGMKIAPCYLQCHSAKTRTHYHCPCGRILIRRNRFMQHIGGSFHAPTIVVELPKIDAEVGDSVQNDIEIEEGQEKNVKQVLQNDEGREAITPKASKNITVSGLKKKVTSSKVHCKICCKAVLKKNIKRHVQEVHHKSQAIEDGNVVVVSPKQGIFLVSRSLHAPGNKHPIHVQYCSSSAKKQIFCEDEKCVDTSQAYGRGSFASFSCKHVAAVAQVKDLVLPNQRQLTPLDLESLVLDRIIRERYEPEIQNTLDNCFRIGVPPVITTQYDPSTSYMYCSVYTEIQKYYSKLGRVVVRFSTRTGAYNCPCSQLHFFCIHKQLASAHIYLNNTDLQEKCHPYPTKDEEQKLSNENLDFQEELQEENDGERDEAFLAYVLKFKNIPINTEQYESDKFPQMLQPLETHCPLCIDHPKLGKPKELSHHATIYDVDAVYRGIPVSVKKCLSCQRQYQYMEYEDGVHNFDNNTVLSLKLCRYLRAGIQNHIAVGRFKDLCANLVGEKYPKNILPAYLHFEASSQHDYNFECIRCGHFPSILTLDADFKVCFNLSAESLMDDTEAEDEVDMCQFWRQLTQGILGKGLKDISSPNIEPKLSFWSPWISPNNCGPQILNTEYRKVSQSNSEGKDESDDIRDVSDDYMDKLLCESKKKDVIETAKKMGVSTKGTKLDMIIRIQEKIKRNSSFRKHFTKIVGKSGGLLVATCPHGVTTAFKCLLRNESVRDHIDILLSLKHQPSVTINDMSGMTAKHGNKRRHQMFHPYNGRLEEPTDQTLSEVLNGNFKKSLPFLDNFTAIYEDSSDHNYSLQMLYHPVTRTNEHYMLSDEFHKGNQSQQEDKLRDCALVPELSGYVNTQTAEQLFSGLGKDAYFMKSMSPQNHLFLMRLLLHLNNEKINSRSMENLEQQQKNRITIGKAADGRVKMQSNGSTVFKSNQVSSETVVEDATREACHETDTPETSHVDLTGIEEGQPFDISETVHARPNTRMPAEEKAPKGQESSKLYCVCQKPYNKKQRMVESSECKDWFHPGCVSLSVKRFKEVSQLGVSYYCPCCSNKAESRRTNNFPTKRRRSSWTPTGKETSSRVKQSKKTSTPPEDTHWVGLRNLGNTCWLNSTLQALLRVFKGDLNEALKRTTGKEQHVLIFLKKMCDQPTGTILKPTELEKKIRSWPSPEMKAPGQKDAIEFLSYVLQHLGKIKVMDPLQTQWTTKYIQCGHEKVDTVEKHFVVYLPMSVAVQGTNDLVHFHSIQECIHGFANFVEVVQLPVTCKCGSKGEVQRELRILTQPDVLFLVLRRYANEPTGPTKVTNRIDINENILLNGITPYELQSVICHVGRTPNSGHYYCIVRDEEKRDIVFDDDTVTAPKQGKLNDITTQVDAYITIYKRCTVPQERGGEVATEECYICSQKLESQQIGPHMRFHRLVFESSRRRKNVQKK